MPDEGQWLRRRRRWIWGCTGGCLGVLLVLFAVVGGFVLWLRHPLPVAPPEVFVSPDAVGFLVVRVEADDPFMVEAAVRLSQLTAVRRGLPAKRPDVFRLDPAIVRGTLLRVSPVQLVVVARPAAEGASPEMGAAAAMRAYSRLYRYLALAMMKKRAGDQAARESYRGASLITIPGGSVQAVLDNNFMLAPGRDTVTGWVDSLVRFREGESGRGAPALSVAEPLKVAYGRLGPQSPVRLAAFKAHGELAAALKQLAEDWPDAEREVVSTLAPHVVTVAAQLAPMNNLDAALTVFVECDDPQVAAALCDAVAKTASHPGATDPLRELSAAVEDGRVVKVQARIENVPGRLAALLEAPRRAPPRLPPK
jgi:hypothetical protein